MRRTRLQRANHLTALLLLLLLLLLLGGSARS
jgi:hypothetical protein